MKRSSIIQFPLFILYLRCPHCHNKQRFERDKDTGIWFPANLINTTYCCDVMANADGEAWHKLVDERIAEAMSGR